MDVDPGLVAAAGQPRAEASPPPGAGPAEPPPAGSLRQRCFTEVSPDQPPVHVQIVDLNKQLYVWISVGGNNLANLSIAVQSPAQSQPSVATLLPGGVADAQVSLSRRLAQRTGRPVMCSVNVPADGQLLQACAERRLLQELADMNLIAR